MNYLRLDVLRRIVVLTGLQQYPLVITREGRLPFDKTADIHINNHRVLRLSNFPRGTYSYAAFWV